MFLYLQKEMWPYIETLKGSFRYRPQGEIIRPNLGDYFEFKKHQKVTDLRDRK
jgi:hypothetical protein